MGCRKIKKLLGPFMDGELPEEARQGVADHLERCSACRRRLESLHKVEALSRQLATAEPDESYWSTFLPRLRARMARTQKKPTAERIREALGRLFAPPVPWVRIAGAVAAAVLVFILGHAVIHHEARMRRVRALPKKLLSEQARGHKERAPQEDVGQVEPRGGPPQRPAEPRAPMDKEAVKPSEEGLAAEKVGPMEISFPPSEDFFLATDQISRLREQVPAEKEQVSPAPSQVDEAIPPSKGHELLTLDRDEEKEKAYRSVAAVGRVSGQNHWRQQIQIWQDSIKAHPRGDQLGQIYFRLAESWYQFAQLTVRREDLLRAVEAHRVALDFAAEEATRKLLRSRIAALEEQLRKKQGNN